VDQCWGLGREELWGKGPMVKGRRVPIVPLPPTLKRPKRAKGEEQMVMLGVSLRMTITLEGSEGMSFDVMVRLVEAAD